MVCFGFFVLYWLFLSYYLSSDSPPEQQYHANEHFLSQFGPFVPMDPSFPTIPMSTPLTGPLMGLNPPGYAMSNAPTGPTVKPEPTSVPSNAALPMSLSTPPKNLPPLHLPPLHLHSQAAAKPKAPPTILNGVASALAPTETMLVEEKGEEKGEGKGEGKDDRAPTTMPTALSPMTLRTSGGANNASSANAANRPASPLVGKGNAMGPMQGHTQTPFQVRNAL
jgi:hypothetical protein